MHTYPTTFPPPHTQHIPVFPQSLVCKVHHGDRLPVNTRRGEEIRREGERGERGRRGGRGRREGSRASICHTATGRRYMICCAHFSILASVSLDTPVYSTWSHSRYSVWRIVWLLSSALLSAQSGTSASGERGRGRITWCHFTDYIIRLTSLANPPTASTNAPGCSATCVTDDQTRKHTSRGCIPKQQHVKATLPRNYSWYLLSLATHDHTIILSF